MRPRSSSRATIPAVASRYGFSRGEGGPGPTADKTVIWSMQTSFAGGVNLVPDNEDARVLMQAGSCRTVKNTKNGGCCEVVKHGTCAPGSPEEFRWSIP